MNSEFETYKTNDLGLETIASIRKHFDGLLEDLVHCIPVGRELSLVRTKLEEASFFAVKAIAKNNQS